MFKKTKPGITALSVILAISIVLAGFMTPLLKLIYPLKYEEYIQKHSDSFELDPYIVMGVISAESGFDESAKSHKDAKGLMQLKEETALWCIEKFEMDIKPEDVNTPDANIHIGCKYVDYLLELYDGNMITAIAAYNAGPGNVDKWLSDPRYSGGKNSLKTIPFPETEQYVKKVQKRAKIYKRLYSN